MNNLQVLNVNILPGRTFELFKPFDGSLESWLLCSPQAFVRDKTPHYSLCCTKLLHNIIYSTDFHLPLFDSYSGTPSS